MKTRRNESPEELSLFVEPHVLAGVNSHTDVSHRTDHRCNKRSRHAFEERGLPPYLNRNGSIKKPSTEYGRRTSCPLWLTIPSASCIYFRLFPKWNVSLQLPSYFRRCCALEELCQRAATGVYSFAHIPVQGFTASREKESQWTVWVKDVLSS